MTATALSNVADRPSQVFRPAPEYRRCGLYLLFFDVVALALVITTKAVGDNPRSWEEVAAVWAVLAVPLVGLPVLIFRHALRVDDAGVWRRRFVRWDLWPWRAFAGGEIRDGV